MCSDGFTLIELLLALALLGVLIPLCLQLEACTLAYIQAARLRTEATRLAENIMEQELAMPTSVASLGEVGPFSWQLERANDELRLQVAWSDSRREHKLEVVTLIEVP